jgi:transitional endoplasmic reticulum ATPase
VDPALLRSGRFDYLLRFTAPSALEREAVFRLCCERVPQAPDVDLRELAERTDGFTGADIESLCKKATLLAIDHLKRAPSGSRDTFVVARRDFIRALDSEQHAIPSQSSVSEAQPAGSQESNPRRAPEGRAGAV